MAKEDFLQNLTIARSLLTHRVQTDSSCLDPHWTEDRLNSAAIWLTPSAVKGFDVREFRELSPGLRTELKENVERFLRVAKQVPPTKPPTTEQLKEAKTALEKVLA